MEFTLRGARLVDGVSDQRHADLVVAGSRIRAVKNSGEDTSTLLHGRGTQIDATGMIVMPGFIDVHTHGGGGYNLHTREADEIRGYARWTPETGVTSFLIAIV